MKIFNKLLVFLCILVMLFVSVSFTVALWFPNVADELLSQFAFARDSMLAKTIISAIVLFILIISIEIICYGISGSQPESVLIKANENGQIRVTVSSIEQIALKASRSVEGVRECKVKARIHKGVLSFSATVALVPGLAIPPVIESVQTTVKSDVELITELPVAGVEVFVDNSILKSK